MRTNDHSSRSLDADTLDRYLAGEATATDREIVAARANRDPSAVDALRLISSEIRLLGKPGDIPPAEAAWPPLAERLGIASSAGTTPRTRPFSPSIGMHLGVRLGVVLSVVALIGLGYKMLPVMGPKPTAGHSRTYTTTPGQVLAITLADGSKVTLAPQTTLTTSEGGHTASREVMLTGEARFEVTARADAPFVVKSGSTAIRVLGTTFDVRRYPGEVAGHIRVGSGKVVAENDRASSALTLTAGMAARFTDSAVTANASESITTDWARGQLMFRDAELRDVLMTLKRWYGYDFRVADSTLATRHVTTAFDMNDAPEMFLRLKRLLRVRMTFADSSIVVLSPVDEQHSPSRKARGGFLHNSMEAGR